MLILPWSLPEIILQMWVMIIVYMIKYLSDLVCKLIISEKGSQDQVEVIMMEESLLLIMEEHSWNGGGMPRGDKEKQHFLMHHCLKGMLILLVK